MAESITVTNKSAAPMLFVLQHVLRNELTKGPIWRGIISLGEDRFFGGIDIYRDDKGYTAYGECREFSFENAGRSPAFRRPDEVPANGQKEI